MAEMSQTEVQELLFQLSRLVEELNRQRSGTPGLGETRSAAPGGVDRGTDRLILALGRLSSQLEGGRKTKSQEQADMLKFAKATEAAGDAQEEQRKQIEENIKAAEAEAKARAETARRAAMSQAEIDDERFRAEQARIAEDKKTREAEKQSRNRDLIDGVRSSRYQRDTSRAVFEQFSATGGMAERLKDGLHGLGGNSLGAQAALQLLTSATEGAIKGMVSMSKSLHRGERGAKVSAEALNELATPILNFTSILGQVVSALSFFLPGGVLVKGAVFLGGALLQGASSAGKLAVELNKLAAEQVDALFKSFRTLSTVGAAGARGLDDVFDTLQILGMTVAEIEEFNSMITQSSQNLVFMGKNAADGARAFGEVAGGLYKSRLGEELEMLGFTAQEQREAALAYLNIQARTGQMQLKNTAQLIQESAKFAKELDLAAQLTGQTRKEQAAAREAALAETRFRAAMVDAQQRGDTGQMARLQAAQQAAALAKAMGDERGFTGILQAAAGGGALTTPEAVAAEMTYRISEIMDRPNMSQMEMAQLMGASIKVQQQQLAGTMAMTGNIDTLSTNFVATANFQERIAQLQEEANRQGLSGPDALLRVLETEQGKRIAAGGDTKTMVEAGRLQQSAVMTQDSALRKFNVAADINSAASKLFDSAVKLFANTVGVKSPAGGTPSAAGGAAGGTAGGAAGAAAGGAAGGAGVVGASGRAGQSLAGKHLAGIMGGIEKFISGGQGFGFYGAGPGPSQVSWDDFITFTSGTGSREHFGRLEPSVQQAFISMAREYNQLNPGKKLQVNSAFRSPEEQANVDSGTNPRAAPGRSLHNVGRAIDIQSEQVNFLKSQGILDRHGFKTLANDPPHIYMRYGGVATGPKAGYEAMLHGTEAVVPLPDNRKIPVEMPNFDRSLREQTDMMSAQLARLDDLVSVMRGQVDISQKILMAANN